MANDLDGPPIYDQLTDKTGSLSNIWVGWYATFIESLTGYLSQYGLFVPKLTTDQRDEIQSPESGQQIFNTTTSKGQMYDGTVWQDLF